MITKKKSLNIELGHVVDNGLKLMAAEKNLINSDGTISACSVAKTIIYDYLVANKFLKAECGKIEDIENEKQHGKPTDTSRVISLEIDELFSIDVIIWGEQSEISESNVEIKFRYTEFDNCESEHEFVLELEDIYSIYELSEKMLDCRDYEDVKNERVIMFTEKNIIIKSQAKTLIIDTSYETDYGEKSLVLLFGLRNKKFRHSIDNNQTDRFSRLLYNILLYCGYDISNELYDNEVDNDESDCHSKDLDVNCGDYY